MVGLRVQKVRLASRPKVSSGVTSQLLMVPVEPVLLKLAAM